MGIGAIVQKLAIARFARTLGTLITSGVPILQAIEITGQAAGNVVIEDAMEKVEVSVKEGQSITQPLSECKVFPAMVTQMISVGEETGSPDAMLGKIVDFYEDEVNAAVKSLTSILEPIDVLFVGALVDTVVISMYLPIFNMMNIVKKTRPEDGVENEQLLAVYAQTRVAGDAGRDRAPQPEPAAPHPQAVLVRERALRGPSAGRRISD